MAKENGRLLEICCH